jgi:hypothetical protein
LGKQEKVTRRRAASGILAFQTGVADTSPFTLRQAQGERLFETWIPAFAGMTTQKILPVVENSAK